MGRRIFVGLPVRAEAAHELAAFARHRLGGLPVRAIEPAMLHATLVFCGPTDEERIAEIVGIVEEETPFDLAWELAPNGLRQLGSAVAITYEAPPLLVAVQRAVERRLAAEGLAGDERRRWLPHVTVARGRARRALPHRADARRRRSCCAATRSWSTSRCCGPRARRTSPSTPARAGS